MNQKVYLIDYPETDLEPRKLDIDFGIVTHQTLADCLKELIEISYNIYYELLTQGESTIICGGQSPSYYCLAMMNFSIYNPEIVNIVILPHSKGGERTKKDKIEEENRMYCQRIKEKNIDKMIRDKVTIIDGVHSGTGILALESALKYCIKNINIKKIAINSSYGISEIPVDQEIILPCEPKFSDTFPRLINSYHPRNFDNSELFINNFINLEDNPIAQMIISVAKSFPEKKVEDSEWFKLNNDITPKIKELKEKYQKELLVEERRRLGGTFRPIILENPKRYQCPYCNTVTGTEAPLNPRNLSLFSHNYYCINRFKIPIE